jgi:hypothetical protein
MRKMMTGSAMLLALALPTAAQAIVTHISRATWEVAAGVVDEPGAVESWEADLSGIPDFTQVMSIALPFSQRLVSSIALEKRTVPGTWQTWAAPETLADADDDPVEVLWTQGAQSFSGTFPTGPVAAFGMEMEPGPFGPFVMTLTLSDGSIITQVVEGLAGARFFGWTDGAITGWTATCAGCDFAIGDIVKADAFGVSEPHTLLLLGSGLLALGAWRRRNARGRGQSSTTC